MIEICPGSRETVSKRAGHVGAIFIGAVLFFTGISRGDAETSLQYLHLSK